MHRTWSLFVVISIAAIRPVNVTATESPTASFNIGINLGNMLEAPREGDWAPPFEAGFAKLIKRAGFDHVRLPVRWSAHTASAYPYAIDAAFLTRVGEVVHTCRQYGLGVVVNCHHYDAMSVTPTKHLTRLVAIWKQVARKFSNYPQDIRFEPLNEPHGSLSTDLWNRIYPHLLAAIRVSCPHHKIIVGGGSWNSAAELLRLRIPEGDPNIVATFHFYDPFNFTHQGAEFLGANAPPPGAKYHGTNAERQALRKTFKMVSDWRRKTGIPVYLGEFGCYQAAPTECRTRWTSDVKDIASEYKIGFAYWEFCSTFGAYDPDQRKWRSELLEALID